jgi:hypothetical protein
MASIVTVAELRSILGVSSALYNDAYLTDIIDTAEQVILPMLTRYAQPIDAVELEDNVATYHTLGAHEFSLTQSIVITGCGSPFNGTFTITAVPSDYEFSVALTNADILPKNVIPSGLATLSGASTYVGVSAVESAVLVVSVEVFQSRVAPGGQIEGVDFTPTPYRMGRSLFNRCVGLLGNRWQLLSLALLEMFTPSYRRQLSHQQSCAFRIHRISNSIQLGNHLFTANLITP